MTFMQRLAATCTLAAGLCALGNGCATQHVSPVRWSERSWTMTGSPALRDARAQVTVRHDDQGNQFVDLAFERLAPAERAFAGARTYTVWLIPRGGPAQNAAILLVGENLTARLSIKARYLEFEVVVTAESKPDVLQPSANRAFHTNVHATT
jgi:hypothetical protein